MNPAASTIVCNCLHAALVSKVLATTTDTASAAVSAVVFGDFINAAVPLLLLWLQMINLKRPKKDVVCYF